MTTSKYRFEQLLAKTYTNIFCKNNQKVYKDWLKPR